MKYLKIANTIVLWLVVGYLFYVLKIYIAFNEDGTDRLIDAVNMLQARVGRT
jgi:hypothetical protein